MKKKTVRYTVKKIVVLCGGGGRGRIAAAEKLGVTLSYLYRLERGKLKPGKRLYADIVRLYKEEMEAKDK